MVFATYFTPIRKSSFIPIPTSGNDTFATEKITSKRIITTIYSTREKKIGFCIYVTFDVKNDWDRNLAIPDKTEY